MKIIQYKKLNNGYIQTYLDKDEIYKKTVILMKFGNKIEKIETWLKVNSWKECEKPE